MAPHCSPKRRRGSWPRQVKNGLRTRWTKIDFKSQDSVLQGRRSVTQHGEVLEVEVGGVNEALSLRTFDRRESPAFDGIGAFAKAKHHFIGIKGRTHKAMIEASSEDSLGNMETQLSTSELWSPPAMARGQ